MLQKWRVKVDEKGLINEYFVKVIAQEFPKQIHRRHTRNFMKRSRL